jgi:hypothetical protein
MKVAITWLSEATRIGAIAWLVLALGGCSTPPAGTAGAGQAKLNAVVQDQKFQWMLPDGRVEIILTGVTIDGNPMREKSFFADEIFKFMTNFPAAYAKDWKITAGNRIEAERHFKMGISCTTKDHSGHMFGEYALSALMSGPLPGRILGLQAGPMFNTQGIFDSVWKIEVQNGDIAAVKPYIESRAIVVRFDKHDPQRFISPSVSLVLFDMLSGALGN